MSKATRSVWKDAGAAIAVFSIYMLTLLVPLHQAAATQSSFAELGYETIGAWPICSAISDADAEENAPFAVSCPVVSLAKNQLPIGEAAIFVRQIDGAGLDAASRPASRAPPADFKITDAAPRAPPMQA